MKIIIAGAGEVGFHLAKLLSYESQEITLIDNQKEKLIFADEQLDIKTIKGDATSIKTLKDSKIESTALFIAVTASETTNITACVLAKQLGAHRTIARISNTEFIEHKETVGFSKFGIDELISPEALASSEIELLLDQYNFNESFQFDNGALTLLSLKVSPASLFINKTVKELALLLQESHFMPIALQRKGSQNTIIPRGDTIFNDGDKVVFMTSEGGDEELTKLSGKPKGSMKNIMILGGSQIGKKATLDLCDKKYNVKLIEDNKNKASDLAEELPKALIINGDGRNVDLLEEESIESMDAFIAVTGHSETNIMSSLMAKSKGVQKTIALVENMDYYQLSYSIGIDSLINKKLLAANSIFRYIRKGDVVAMTKLSHMKAEILEFIVKPSSKICNKRIKNLKIPNSVVFGGVIRDQKGFIPLGDFLIQAGDHVVVCSLPQTLSVVESYFL